MPEELKGKAKAVLIWESCLLCFLWETEKLEDHLEQASDLVVFVIYVNFTLDRVITTPLRSITYLHPDFEASGTAGFLPGA